MKLVLRYTLFAGVAMVLNLLGQELALRIYTGPLALYISILAGTAVGLVSKYLLDKLFIFNYRSSGLNDDLNRFVAYSFTGVFTTLLFWGFELGFELLFGSKQARYLGAVIGLSIGYVIKYQLDKRYVFQEQVA